MITPIPQASFRNEPMSSRWSSSSQISTTAIGCRKHSSSSRIFRVIPPLGLHLRQRAVARGLVLAPAEDLGAMPDAAVGRVVKRDLEEDRAPQRDPLNLLLGLPAARVAVAADAGLIRRQPIDQRPLLGGAQA